MPKNKNLITISMPQKFHEMARELGLTRKALANILISEISHLYEERENPFQEDLELAAKIAKTKWIIDDEK